MLKQEKDHYGEKKYSIAYVDIGKHLGGAEKIVFDLLDNLNKDRFCAIFICCDNSLVKEAFLKKNCKSKGVYINPSRYLLGLSTFEIIRVIKKNKVDLIHCHGALGALVGTLAGKITQTRVVTTIHSDVKRDYKSKLKGKIYVVIEKIVSKGNAKYVAVSNYLKNQLIERNIQENKVICIHNGVAYQKSRLLKNILLQEIQVKKNFFKIVCIGRLEYVKGQDLLIDALSQYKDINKNFHCWFIGEGSTKKELENKILTNQLQDEVTIKGYQTCIPEILECVDVAVVASRMESLSLVAIEALQHKCIVLGTDAGGVMDVIDDGENGFLFQNSNVTDMKEKLEYINEHQEQWNQLKDNGLRKARNVFSLESMINSYEKTYETIITKKKYMKR